jgi:hypothetical protein
MLEFFKVLKYLFNILFGFSMSKWSGKPQHLVLKCVIQQLVGGRLLFVLMTFNIEWMIYIITTQYLI